MRLLYHFHYPPLSGNIRKRTMYINISVEYYWPHIERNGYTTAAGEWTCAPKPNQPIISKAYFNVSCRGSLELVFISILERLPETYETNQGTLVMKYRYTMFTKTVPMLYTTKSHIVSLFYGYLNCFELYTVTDQWAFWPILGRSSSVSSSQRFMISLLGCFWKLWTTNCKNIDLRNELKWQ